MDLKTYALMLKKELEDDPLPQTAHAIALKIEKAIHEDGTLLSEKEKDHILKYIEFPGYDPRTGRILLHEADNSEFLKLVAIVAKNIKSNK